MACTGRSRKGFDVGGGLAVDAQNRRVREAPVASGAGREEVAEDPGRCAARVPVARLRCSPCVTR
jgi:hypothetical protein